MADKEFDQLYKHITQVKMLCGHKSKPWPENSMSLTQLDNLWSKMGQPIGSSEILTDGMSVVDGGGMQEEQLEVQQAEFESWLQLIRESTEAEDLKVEKEHLQHQFTLVQAQMRRLLKMRSRGTIDEQVEMFELIIYTARQLGLIRKVLDKWMAHCSFSMAETVLSSAVLVKDVNVLSKELGKDVSYNFTVASGGSLAAPASRLETIAGLGEFGDVADPVLASATQPSPSVRRCNYPLLPRGDKFYEHPSL